ncbi:50S ribosomal protein L31 [Zavarzinia sp.]|uniref:50S ribosomal protein L31 n=1 Tax=Zavarzinia sp. TaxID=2027920 RepID=UPI003BB807F4|nr:50S ribosomal protein L31 [Zavarzinia sp.]
MKEGIHPDYHVVTVEMTDGTVFQTRSTWGKEGDVLKLDIDKSSHPAWTGGNQRIIDTGGMVARFNKRFSKFGIK